MLITPTRKNKVVLADYAYRRDIENRVLIANLSVFDVDVLNELLSSSLSFPIADIIQTLEASHTDVVNSLNKFIPSKLLQHDGHTIRVDKDMRKYYEFQIEKFDEDFTPDLEYIFRGLKRIPIQVLPNWYSIPRSTDDIFDSIVEKYLLTPKIYLRHLSELNFEDPIPHQIMDDVFAAEDFKVRSKTLRDKYDLSREQFEEYMLLLEYNFVCYLGYTKIGDQWKEVVTPIHEWREYLRFQRDTVPQTIPEDKVKRFHKGDHYAFTSDLTDLLQVITQQPLRVDGSSSLGYSLSSEALTLWAPALATEEVAGYCRRLVSRLLQIHLVEVRDGKLIPTVQAKEWFKKAPADQAMVLYRLPVHSEDYPSIKSSLFTEKNLREVEKAVKRVLKSGWVAFDDFVRGMSEPLGDSEPISLRQKGKRWSFVLPTYSAEEQVFVKEMIFQRLFQVGIVTAGTYDGQPCFTVTSFGRIALGD